MSNTFSNLFVAHSAKMQSLLVTSLIASVAVSSKAASTDTPTPSTPKRPVAGDYTVPTLTLPYAQRKPRIDGNVDDEEWSGAISINGLQTTQRQISLRPTRFWLMWDEDHIYMAMRSPLRPKERVIQAMREMDRDVNAVWDDSYEIYVDANTQSPDGQPVFFQFLSNFAGARWDVMHEPAVGNFRMGWKSGWQPKSRITANNEWELEVVIPRQSIYRNKPWQDGDEIRGLLARNFKRPWEQNSVEGTGSFSVRETYSHWKLSREAPAIHLFGVGDVTARTVGLQLGATQTGGNSSASRTLRWQFDSDSGLQKSGELQPGTAVTPQVTELRLEPAAKGTPPGSFRIRVFDGDRTLLDWSALRQFGDRPDFPASLEDKGDVVGVSLQYNPVHDYLRVKGDFINFDDRARVAQTTVEVRDSAGKKLAEQNLQIDEAAYVRGVLKFPTLPAGTYRAVLTAYDNEHHKILERQEEFEKKDHKTFAWWDTKRGNIEKVIAPWTPVKYAGGRFDVWGRGMRVGGLGLPQQIVSQGSPMLAHPAYLVVAMANGKILKSSLPLVSELQTQSSRENRAIVQTRSMLGDLAVRTKVTVEFDGMYKVEMTLDPHRALDVKWLKVVVPLRDEVADYIHAAGEGIRYGSDFRFLPKRHAARGTGKIWDSTRVDSQPMAEGSFIPYLWIGHPQKGLCWFADSDKGWTPNNVTPALEIRRDAKDSTDLVMNIISAPERLNPGKAGSVTAIEPRTVTFALQATPVKPLHKGWRMDSWWCGDTFRDYAQVEPKGGSLIFTSIPFTLDLAKSREMVEAQKHSSSKFNFGVDLPANAVPYFEHIRIGAGFIPEMKYFGDEWQTNVTEGLYYGKTFQDFMVYNYSRWSEQAGIQGVYFDNVHPLADANMDAGRGYRLRSGKVQPEYAMFSTREYFLRVRAAILEQQPRSKIVIHMTNNMIIPWVGAADVAYDGENHVIYPQMKKDFIDFWDLERMRVDYPHQWGVAVNFMQEYQGDWQANAFAKAMRAYSAMAILHDALPSGNANGLNTPLWIGRNRFGIAEDDVTFIPYWQEHSGVKTTAKDVLLAIWKRPGKILLAVVNRGEATTAPIEIDSKRLGLGIPSGWKVSDAEAGTSIAKTYIHRQLEEAPDAWNAADQKSITQSGNILSVPVERHDYRQIIIEAGS